jgi:lipid A oxidase
MSVEHAAVAFVRVWPEVIWPARRQIECLTAVAAMAVMIVASLPSVFPMSDAPDARLPAAGLSSSSPARPETAGFDAETILAGYLGNPSHNRSDAHLERPGGTDLTLKNLRWEAEPFHFPIYAGVRAIHWRGPFGGMIDFLHDKAIAHVGKGAHGRKLTGEGAIPDTIETTGTLNGNPAPSPVKITDILERLEFSHGHNMLIPTALLRLGSLGPLLRPYVGLGAGVALPHVEVWPAGEGEASKTNEYQAAGPAFQAVIGLELQGARSSYFLEYKFTYASLATALTGGKTPSWCNCDFVSDAARHIRDWWNGTEPAYGHLSTTLVTHQLVGGAGYRLTSGTVAGVQ